MDVALNTLTRCFSTLGSRTVTLPSSSGHKSKILTWISYLKQDGNTKRTRLFWTSGVRSSFQRNTNYNENKSACDWTLRGQTDITSVWTRGNKTMTEEHKKKKKNEAPQRRFSKLKWADMFFWRDNAAEQRRQQTLSGSKSRTERRCISAFHQLKNKALSY